MGRVRQVYELTIEDLEQYPIWEHALDEEGEENQDEATVKPRPDLKEADPGEGMFIVRAEMTAKDGTRYCGYCYPDRQDSSLGMIQPQIVTEKGQVLFWFGLIKPEEDKIRRYYDLLGKTSDQLFPLRFKALVPTKGVGLDGFVPSFLYRTREGQIVEVR